jgi:hypothetical protein
LQILLMVRRRLQDVIYDSSLYKKVDSDGDGVLSKSELEALLEGSDEGGVKGAMAMLPNISVAIRKMEMEGNALASTRSFTAPALPVASAAQQCIAFVWSDQKARLAIETFDADGGGKLDAEELMNYMHVKALAACIDIQDDVGA